MGSPSPETGETRARKQGHPKGSKLEEHEAFLLGLVAEKDDVTLAEMQAQLRAERGVSTGTTTLWRFFDARGLTLKKSAHAAEQDRPDPHWPRRAHGPGRSHQPQRLPGLCGPGACARALARRRGRDGQPRHHKEPAVRRTIEAAGAWLFYLPPYSPDFNPIEKAFAKLKSPTGTSSSIIWRSITRRERRHARAGGRTRLESVISQAERHGTTTTSHRLTRRRRVCPRGTMGRSLPLDRA